MERFSRFQSIKMPVTAEIEGFAGDGDGGEGAFVDRVFGELGVFFGGRDDGAFAFLAEEINAAIGGDGRSGMVAADAMLPMGLAGFGVEAGGDTVVANHVDLIGGDDGRGGKRDGARVGPDDVRFGDVAAAVWLNGEEHGLEEAGADINHPVGVDGAGDIGETVAVFDVPEFLAGLGIVSVGVMGAGADDLGLAGNIDDEGRGVGLVALAARRLPADFTGGGIEGDDELGVEAVATEDEEILEERGGAAGAMLGLIFKGLLPEDFTFGVEAGGAIEAEVDVDFAAVDDGGG